MKRFFKRNKVFILILIIMLSYFIYQAISYNINEQKLMEAQSKTLEYCKNELINSNNPSEYCKKVISSENDKMDFFTKLTDMLSFRLNLINPLAFVFLIIPTLINVCQILKYRFIINAKTRESSKRFYYNYFKIAYKYVWLLPLFAFLVIIFCKYQTTFDPSYAINYHSSNWTSSLIYHPYLFIFLYLLNIFLYSCIFINIGLIVARKQHNYVTAIILSILTYIGIELFLEIFVNVIIFGIILKTDIGPLFNIMNLFTFSDVDGTANLLLFTTAMFILTSVLVLLSYKNTEKLIIDCEKNN